MSLLKNNQSHPEETDSVTTDLTHPISSIYNSDLGTLHAYEIIKDLIPFEHGFCSLNTKQQLSILWQTLYSVLALAPSQFSRILIDTSGLIYLNQIGDKNSQALFGVFDTYYIVFYICLIGSLIDKFSIDISKAFGDKDFMRVREVFTKSSITTLMLFFLFTLPSMIFAEPFLRLIGIDEEKASSVQEITRYALPLIIVNMISEVIKSHCLALGHEQIIGYSSLITMVLTVGANYFVIVQYRLGIQGWILSKTGNEVVSLLIATLVYFRTPPETRGFVSLKQACSGFCSFFGDAMKYMLSVYPECLGFVLTLYFILLKNDDDQTAAYNCLVNITALVFCFGFAFAIVCRTRMNILIGMGKKSAAKNYFKFFIAFTFLIGSFIGGLLIVFRGYLALLFSNSTPEIKAWFYRLVLIYSTVAGIQLSINPILVGMKSIGKVGLLLFLNIVLSLMCSLSTGYILYRLGYHCDVQFGNYMILGNLLTIIVLIITLCSDWSKIKVK